MAPMATCPFWPLLIDGPRGVQKCLGFEVLGPGFEVLGLGFEVLGPGSEVLGLGFEVLGPSEAFCGNPR